MKFTNIVILILTILSICPGENLLAQLKGSLSYEELEGFERSASENPCIRIKSTIPDLYFSWSGGSPKVAKKGEDWIIVLRPGLQTLLISAHNFESLDINLDLRRYEAKTYRIIPVIKQFYLKVETKPHEALVTLKELKSNKIIQGNSPFEHFPVADKYRLQISRQHYVTIDTILVFKANPITSLYYALEKSKNNENLNNPQDSVIVLATEPIIENPGKKNKLKKYLAVAGSISVAAWLTSALIMDQRKESEKAKKLPGVPEFPKP